MIIADAILNIVSQAKNELVIVAPYIKVGAFQRILDEAPDNLHKLTCVSRWRPEDIAAGVCDLEIFDLLSDRPNSQLLVHPYLHAKYYRGDAICQIGSANVTYQGLGWATPPNFELTVELPSDFDGLQEWEKQLLSDSIPVTPELRDKIAEEAERIRSTIPPDYVFPGAESEVPPSTAPKFWLPTCPVPDRLWDVYQDKGEITKGTMIESAREAAQADLRTLNPPKGLTQDLFTAYIAGMLKLMPLIEEIDQLVSTGLNDPKAHELLTERLGSDCPDPATTWQTLKEWLIFFYPNKYRDKTVESEFVKEEQLPR